MNFYQLCKKYLTSSAYYCIIGAAAPKSRHKDYTFWSILSNTFFARLVKIVVDLLLARPRQNHVVKRDSGVFHVEQVGRQAALVGGGSWMMRHGAPLILPYGTGFFCRKHSARICASMRASDSAVWSSMKP